MFNKDNSSYLKFWLEYKYPLTVVSDRYGGAYSGSDYTAWPLLFYKVPREIEGDDVTCSCFWHDADKDIIGFGSTPRKAINDLVKKIEKRYNNLK